MSKRKKRKEENSNRDIRDVRMHRAAYEMLIKVKGELIAERGKNVSLSETVETLVTAYRDYRVRGFGVGIITR